MELRLAFAVAAHFEPDVIVVDEVLAVGDVEFQRRCLGRMSELTEEGRTVLFVTHDHGAMARLVSRVVWLEAGEVVADGPAPDVLRDYLGSVPAVRAGQPIAPRRAGAVVVRSVDVFSQAGQHRIDPVRGSPLHLSVAFELTESVTGFDVGFYLKSEDGTWLLNEAWSDEHGAMPVDRPGEYTATLVVPAVLTAGRYTARAVDGFAVRHADRRGHCKLRHRAPTRGPAGGRPAAADHAARRDMGTQPQLRAQGARPDPRSRWSSRRAIAGIGSRARSACVQQQQGVTLQIVVVDDGSADGTAQRAQALGDSRILVVRHERSLGLSGARNAGIRASTGEWIAFLDDDDLWSETKLITQLRAARRDAAGWCFAGAAVIDDRGRLLGLADPPDPLAVVRLLRGVNVIPAGASNVLVRAALLYRVGEFDERLSHFADWDLWIRLAAAARPATVESPCSPTSSTRATCG